MNLTYFRPKMRGNAENKNNNPVNIRCVDKTSTKEMKVKIKTLAWKQLSHSTWLAIMTCYFPVFLLVISAFCLLFG